MRHESSTRKSVEWYTPAWLFERLALRFDLDPCHPAIPLSWIPATRRFSERDNGLTQAWHGCVWMNPPYSPLTGKWVEKFLAHANGVAMLFSRTDTAWFHHAAFRADAFLFLRGRVEFVPGAENCGKSHRCGAATVMFACGANNAAALQRLSDLGVYFDRGDVVHREQQQRRMFA